MAGVGKELDDIKTPLHEKTHPIVRGISTEQIAQVVSTVIKSFKGGVNFDNIVNIIILLMEQVKTFSHLRGIEKKTISH